MTNNLGRRVCEHKTKVVTGLSQRYGVDRLVWYEPYDRIEEAIVRENQLKKWRRSWKLHLIEAMNPEWLDL